MTSLITLLAEQSAAAPMSSVFGQLIPIGLLFIGMYFLLIAPQKKKQKQHQEMINKLESGDNVLTTSGIYGTINAIKDDRIVLKVGENTKIEINKSFIHSKIAEPKN